MIRPPQILQVCYCLLSDAQFSPDQPITDQINTLECNSLLAVIKKDLICRAGWPVLITLDLPILFEISEHDDQTHIFLVTHAPEVVASAVHRSLRCYEYLFVPLTRRVDVVGIYVRIVDVLRPLSKPHPRMLV